MVSRLVDEALDDLHAAVCSDGAPSARNLLLTVFGDCVVPHGIGTTVAVADLTQLLSPFGANERLVRTSLSRLTSIGLLAPTSVGRRSFYGVAPSAVERFARADARIYGPRHPRWDGRWTVAVIDANEGTPDQRARFRLTLGEAGFGSVAPNVLASPVVAADCVAPLAEAAGLKHVLVLRGDLPPTATGVLDGAALASRSTDLGDVEAAYRAFVERFAQYPTEAVRRLDGEAALKLRLLLIGTYRRIILSEPLLPAGLAPDEWVGERARDVIAALYAACAEASERYVSSVLGFRPKPPKNRFSLN